jgi:DNA-binding GntR family transcriptional regulator
MTSTGATPLLYGKVQDAAADRIREMILSGKVEPGEWLRQDDLAKALGFSTMPIREALRQLQAEGLVKFHPRRGAFVAELSVSHHQEIYRIREELEVLACQWVAEDFARLDLSRLKQLLGEIEVAEKEADITRRLELVRAFFFTIFEATGKEHLLRILSNVWDLSQQYRRYFATVPEISARRILDYRCVYEACAARDGQALVKAIRSIHAFGESQIIPLLEKIEYDT